MRAAAASPALAGGWVGLLLITALGVSAATVLFLFDPLGSSLYPPCPFHALTGLHCPGCGSLRASHHLLHGELGAAFGYNPLMVLATPVVLYAWTAELWLWWSGKRWPSIPSGRRAVSIFLAVLGLFWVLRNLPWYPFNLLAP